MFVAKDFSNWEPYDGASEGSGRSEKIWLISEEGTIGLFKFPKIDPSTDSETTEHISEHLAHQIGNILGVKTAKVDLGMYKERIGSMSYLVIQSPYEAMIEGIHFINALLPGYDPNTLQDKESKHYYSIEHILKSTEAIVSEEAWIEMMLFDFLIGNADRHQSNWAIVFTLPNPDNDSIKTTPSPLYDNGSSLCCYVNIDQLQKMTGTDPGPFNALIGSKSKSVIRIDKAQKTKPRHQEVAQYLITNYPQGYPISKRFLDKLTSSEIDNLLDKYPENLLSNEKNNLIRKFLKGKLAILKELIEEYDNNAK